MTVKVNYDIKTTVVKGYYPDWINYTSISEPYIEISDEEHQKALGKQMCVVDGVIQQYIKPDSEKLIEEKATKTAECQAYLQQTDWYITRMSDPSSAAIVPENILANRANARIWQNDIKQAQTLEELNNININFN